MRWRTKHGTRQEQGKLRVTDGVCAHVSNCPATWQAITIKQLLTHTCDLSDVNELTEAEVAAYLAEFGERPAGATRQRLLRPTAVVPAGHELEYSNCDPTGGPTRADAIGYLNWNTSADIWFTSF